MTELPGTWYDGRDGRAHRVNLVLDDNRMLRIETEECDLEFPIATVRITPRLGRTPRVLHLPAGGQIECVDSPLLDEWFGPPGRIDAAAYWLKGRRGAALVAAVLTVGGIVALFKYGLP